LQQFHSVPAFILDVVFVVAITRKLKQSSISAEQLVTEFYSSLVNTFTHSV